MRVVLRVEVEAVKFLKEEPHRLDALLKRCKTITDTLTTMRKYERAPTKSNSTSVLLSFVCQLKNWCCIKEDECKYSSHKLSLYRLGNGKILSDLINIDGNTFAR